MEKKLFTAVLLLAILMFAFGIFVGLVGNKETKNETYALTGKVVNIAYATDTVTIVDCNSNYWQFKGTEDYEINDIVACIVDTKGTDLIKDDEIISARYNGVIWDWFE